jgi:Ser/Thr protein kinase RdoA (MazF antagonist)
MYMTHESEPIVLRPSVIETVHTQYGLSIKSASINAGSYSHRVWNIDTNKGPFILKLLLDTSRIDIVHHDAEAAFAYELNIKSIGTLETVRFVKSSDGKTLQHIEDDDYLLLQNKAEIITKSSLTNDEQIQLGKLLSHLHTTMAQFSHPGLGTTDYMRTLKDEEREKLPLIFLDKGYEPYLEYMRPANYEQLGLAKQVIHGDWHQANMSFSKPPLLFDLDTLALGSRIEEIARMLTHWWIEPEELEQFRDNLLRGYGPLSQIESELLPKFVIAQLYRKYFEFLDYNDQASADRVKDSIPYYVNTFKLA